MTEPRARGNAPLPDRFAGLTDKQREAITTTGRSLLVSAAAGSGKTTVLAERCAHLVCEVGEPDRCNVDELLVVTFTDAAAGEMRTRIGKAIRERLSERPNDGRLRNQLFLLDSASISTIHSFCKTIVQKWFPQAGIDPQAAMLGGEESELLRLEVLDALFVEFYGRDDELGLRFQSLVDDYGAGRDEAIAEVVLKVHSFINSLADPQAWLNHSVEQLDPASPHSLIARADELQHQRLRDELESQADYWQTLAMNIRRRWPIAESRAEAAETMFWQLKNWLKTLDVAGLDAWCEIAAEVAAYCFTVERAPGRVSEEDRAAYKAAKDLLDKAKGILCSRVQEGICLFTIDEYRAGLERIAPYVVTMTRIVREFDERYEAAKVAQAAMDFNDLQRGALRLLAADGDPSKPSDIARLLQRQYRHVLVDEFQDIDPLQASILRLVSRETAEPPEGNLFAVGDIKQSIYRFRLAEPRLFSERADEFSGLSTIGTLIPLQQNFRSRREIIDAVNAIFEGLMNRSFGGSNYDDSSRLYAGVTYPETAEGPTFGRPAVEVHLLEPVTQRTAVAPLEAGDEDDAGDDELEGIEREGLLIAKRIQAWMGIDPGHERMHVTERPASPGRAADTRPIRYGDIVILMRSMLFKAVPIADILRRMQIPVRLEVSNDRLDSTEFRDVLSLLQVLDNRQQDIPLAAVLRSPLLADPLNESELLRIRLSDRSVPFHEAVAGYITGTEQNDLRNRLALAWEALDRWRDRIRREPVADVLWDIYEQTGYLGYVAGLPDGARRQGHLLRLHELARQFGRFARQGLRRFLRYLEDLVKHERAAPQPAPPTQEDAVRIMTIHASKGLEFPVVIVADLAKKFNLSDSHGVVLVDREIGLAMQVADPERRIRYPTLIHQLASRQIRQENLSEELRVLYVALTRAREHLVLIGRGDADKLGRNRTAEGADAGPALARMELETAVCPLDWLLAAIGRLPTSLVHWFEEPESGERPLFEVQYYPRTITDSWVVPSLSHAEAESRLADLADLKPLPKDEPLAEGDVAARLITALAREYPAAALTGLPARMAVSELERRWDPTADPDERIASGRTSNVRMAIVERPAFLADAAPLATDVGTATHRFLQLVDLKRPCDAADLTDQRDAFVAVGRLSESEAGMIEVAGAAWFFETTLGRLIRSKAEDVRREIAFVYRVTPEQCAAGIVGQDSRDVVLVRGMIDLLLLADSGLAILDYKTDRIEPAYCHAAAESYRGQLDAYSAAVSAIWKLPVLRRSLVFLHARQMIDLGSAGASTESVGRHGAIPSG